MAKKKIFMAALLLVLVLSLGSCAGNDTRQPHFANDGVENFDWNNAVKILLSNGLGEVPYAGWLMESLVEIFWPDTKTDVWSQIKDQVKAMIDEEITAEDYRNLSEKLDGLNGVLQNYLTILKDSQSNPQDISDAFEVAYGLFLSDLPAFQASEHDDTDKIAFLPLFAQFATMHLTLQRDGVLYGATWGWTSGKVADRSAALTKSISDYLTFSENIITAGRNKLKLPKAVDPHSATSRWKIENRYYRGMTLLVRDFSHAWPYFDVVKYPPGQVTSSMTCPRREIYSDPYGAMDIGNNPSGTNFPTDWTGKNPPKMMTQVEIWGWDLIDAARVWYGGTAAAKMGGSGGSSSSPHGGTFTLDKTNPFVEAWGSSGDIIESLGFSYKNGVKTHTMPGGSKSSDMSYGASELHAGPYSGHIMSSIHIPGVSGYYKTADAITFGFRLEACYQPDEQ